MSLVSCPVCSREVLEADINEHLDRNCVDFPGEKTKNVAPIFKKTRPAQSECSEPQTRPSSSAPKRQADKSLTGAPLAKKHKISHSLDAAAPLAEKLRPRSLSQFVGQAHLLGSDSLLMQAISRGNIGSFVLWGPPGCGKTTLSRLIAHETGSIFKELSATSAGIGDVRKVVDEAKNTLALTGRKTILFLDEIHRFSRSQQDIFLPFVEQGHIQLVGATTENPSIKLTSALLSRCRVYVLNRLTDDDIKAIVANAIAQIDSSPTEPSAPSVPFPSRPHITEKVLTTLISLANGDARIALSLVELSLEPPAGSVSEDALLDSLRKTAIVSYSRTGDDHYDMISALHKSIRGSHADAALYWLARMLNAGEDPMFIARRLVVCASEDIGLADNHGLVLATATMQACQMVGMPECRINLAHLVAYLAEAPKSTRAYEAYNLAEAKAKEDPTAPVPMQVRNAPTKLMKDLGYGNSYRYDPDYMHPVHNTFLPQKLEGEKFLRKVGDRTGKIWDEEALKEWELVNDVNWEGRTKCT